MIAELSIALTSIPALAALALGLLLALAVRRHEVRHRRQVRAEHHPQLPSAWRIIDPPAREEPER
jgi:hypothetical protein